MNKADIVKALLKGTGKTGWFVLKWGGIGTVWVSKKGFKATRRGINYYRASTTTGTYLCGSCRDLLKQEEKKPGSVKPNAPHRWVHAGEADLQRQARGPRKW